MTLRVRRIPGRLLREYSQPGLSHNVRASLMRAGIALQRHCPGLAVSGFATQIANGVLAFIRLGSCTVTPLASMLCGVMTPTVAPAEVGMLGWIWGTSGSVICWY